MSTPTPIFEDLVIRQLEDNLDDVVACSKCSEPAVVRVITRCCGRKWELCTVHRLGWEMWVFRHYGDPASCATCALEAPLTFDLYRVVTL